MNYALHRDNLAKGETVSFRPKGNSMRPRIESGQLVTVSPDVSDIKEGDIAFCRVRGSFYVHLVSALRKEGENTLYQISNNRGYVNGWIGRNSLYGKVVKVED